MAYPKLNFPAVRMRARHSASGKTEVFDMVRGRWLVLTPEEWVRRHVVEYLRTECGFQPQQVIEEYPVQINGMAQRADIVVVGRDAQPLIVVECKEPEVKIDCRVINQVVRYNSVLGCQYVVITNGMTTCCYRCEKGEYLPMNCFPTVEMP